LRRRRSLAVGVEQAFVAAVAVVEERQVRRGAVLVVAAGPWRRVGVDGAALRAREREREWQTK
jgi:hypothetical protein